MAESGVYIPQTKVDWTSESAYSQFRLWRREVDRIINGPLAGKTNAVKLNHVYIWAGAHAEQLIEARTSEDPSIKITDTKSLLDELELCLTHSTQYREAREEFYNIRQNPAENTTTYFSRIIDLYKQAKFPENTDFLIVDKLIHGCVNKECKRKLMAKGTDATIKSCLELLRRYESVDASMRRLDEASQSTPSTQVAANYSRDPSKFSQRNGGRRPNRQGWKESSSKPRGEYGSTDKCSWCANEPHPREKCPAKESQCSYCLKRGHFERACIKKKKELNAKGKRQNAVTAHADHEFSDYEYDDAYDLGCITIQAVSHTSTREILANVQFHQEIKHCRKEETFILEAKVDTGAMVSCIPVSLLPKIGLSQADLAPSSATLRGVSGADLQNCGIVDSDVTCNKQRSRAQFYVTNMGTEAILGLPFCKKFNLVQIAKTCIQREITLDDVDAVHIKDESEADYTKLQKRWKEHLPLGKKTGDPLEDLKSIFPTTFDGNVGLFEGEVSLSVKPEAKPIQLPPRAVPQSILPKLKTELDKMEAEGIIRACPETTEWVHNLVLVTKKNGDLRLCLDPRNLNKYLIRSVHYTASWEDAKHSFQNGKFFSTLDAKSGYWTKCLSADSQPLTAFNTPFKKYCFIRLPFGLSVSSEIFCEQMDRALDGIPGTFPCADDVKVQGSTEERHDIHLLETVRQAAKAGLKFNPNKCNIKKEEIEYFGRVVTPGGIKPCPKKVAAIMNLQAPVDKQELQSLLGTVNFMATFIPNLAKKTHLMRGLLKKDVHFTWTSDMDEDFKTIKQSMAKATELAHYYPDKTAVIETDASQKGLGAVLIQDGRPVRFLSKALTPTEADYANIERELLAVLFACEKLHNYTFGRKVSIHTDHKPLEAIFQKPISLAPSRLQRMLLRLSKYDLEVKYVGAKSVLLADTLSRLVKAGRDPEIPGLDVNIAQVLHIKPSYLESLQEENKSDETLQNLRNFIMNGWPESMQDLPEKLHPFWCFRDELTVLDGVAFKGNRILVPDNMRPSTLKRLHDGHQGLTKTLQRARRSVYWPKMQVDINSMIDRCEECQVHGNKKPRTPERQVSATRPSEILGVDLMDFKGKKALVTIDYFSGFITLDPVSAETTDAIIAVLNSNFRKFGLVERIVSDNGPCFKSEKFHKFCEDLEISLTTTSPHYHESNGRVERAIQTVKQMLRRSNNEGQITLAMITYHDTPVNEGLPSPAELFFSRRINTRLGLMHMTNQLSDSQRQQLTDKRSQHLKEPRNAGPEFVPNQPIWFTEDGSAEWRAGYVDSRDVQPHSYWIIIDSNSRRLRRNRHDLKPRQLIAKRMSTEPISQTQQEEAEPERTSPESHGSPSAPEELSTRPSEEQAYPKNQDPLDVQKSRSGRLLKSRKDPDFVY